MHTDFTLLVENAIKSLVNDNKTPSVALVKMRLTQPVPMPLIIKALQRWKATGQIPKIELVEQALSKDARIDALEKQIASLEARLSLLEQHSLLLKIP